MNLKECITQCWDCRHICQETFFTHCLEAGGKHTQPEHVRLMVDCMQACQLAADMMTRHSPVHLAACIACAEICEACAASCEKLADNPYMQQCAEACRRCAETCRRMSRNHQKAA